MRKTHRIGRFRPKEVFKGGNPHQHQARAMADLILIKPCANCVWLDQNLELAVLLFKG